VPQLPAVPRAVGLTEATQAVFEETGALARAVPGFEPRAGQREMASAVAETLEAGGTLLVEAGTGTGKTLAYLAPAVLSRKRVLVSTGTKNLQEQIFLKDLPALRDALGVPFTATCMKGRTNYLCLQRFDAFRDRPVFPSIDDRDHLRIVERWAAKTETGDRAELDELPEDLPFWSEISATAEQCLGSECPRYQECFITQMRQRAAASDLVIVNHHLLCADAAVRHQAFGQVIPECHYAIIDEAHQLEDVATQHFGYAVSNYRVDELAHDADRALAAWENPAERTATGPRSRRRAKRSRARGERKSEERAAVDRVRGHALAFFEGLERCRRLVSSGDERLRFARHMAERLFEPGERLIAALDALEATVRLLKEPGEDLLSVARRAHEIREQLAQLLRADDPDYVFFLETRGRGIFLRAAPIDVSGIIGRLLIEPLQATVLTSATLAVDGSFEYVRSRLGLLGARTLLLPSEFDFAEQAVLYLPRRMPDPRSLDFTRSAAAEILALLRLSSGRAFVLFTSYAALREVRAVIDGRLPYPVLVQGSAPRTALLQQFRETPHAVLLATSSFWQGVDVAGDALSCVIVDKLPFASPGDPITAARIEAVNSAGGNAFADYQVPLAILTLKQGLGRLIRTRSDRGVLAVLDPRIRTMGYGARFLAGLPPAPVTHRLEDVGRFFA
jgi:ATP-dependent DNA helicase DinG